MTGELESLPEVAWKFHTWPEGLGMAGAVLHLAEEADASLLIIGFRRRRAMGKLLLGMVVQRVLTNLLVRVLMVKEC